MATIFDGHSDLLYDVTRRRLEGESRVLERRHLDRLRRGGVEGLVLALWYGWGGGRTFWPGVPGGESPAHRLEVMLACAQAEFAQCPWLAGVRTAEAAESARAEGKRYAILAIEGLDGLEGPEALDRLAALGLRLGTLTWNEENRFASGATQDPGRGLTPLGRQMVRRMEELGIVVDVSHLNDGGFRDVMRLAAGPVIASHSNCRALCPHPRNLSDEQLRAIRGCGFDFCEFMGPGNDAAAGLEDCGRAGAFLECLGRLGMSPAEREQIARGNLLRIFREKQ